MVYYFLLALSVVSVCCSAYGSFLFVDKKDSHGIVTKAEYQLGSMWFLVGNSINVAMGLHIGDLVLVSSQLGLVWFTIPMLFPNPKRWFLVSCPVGFCVLVLFLGTANSFHFTASVVGAIASFIAILGAWFMSKQSWTKMAWCWLIADLIFIYVAVINRLPLLGVLAVLFVYHSAMRLLGYKRVGLFSFEK